MSATALLLWMSARRHGSWQQFRAAVEELHTDVGGGGGGDDDESPGEFPLYQALRFNLQRLGHAEFFAGAGDAEWRVTPPCLAMVQHPRNWLGILVGGRSLALKKRVEDSVGTARFETREYARLPGANHSYLGKSALTGGYCRLGAGAYRPSRRPGFNIDEYPAGR